MTTIAFRDGVMAADSQMTSNGNYYATVEKIKRLSCGGLYACSGDADSRELFNLIDTRTLLGQMPSVPELLELELDANAIVILPNGKAYEVCVKHESDRKRAEALEMNAPFLATGSGWELAMGAMAMGASAKEAVKIACQFDVHSGGPIKTKKIK